MKNVLLLSDINFWEDSSGHRVRLAAMIAYLASHVNLTVVNTGPVAAGAEALVRSRFNVGFFVLEERSALDSEGYGRRLKSLFKRKVFDAVIIEYIHSSYFLNYLNGRPMIILDAHDIIHERNTEFKRYHYPVNGYELSADREMEILNYYDYVLAICHPDRVKLAASIGNKALLCPHPVQIHHVQHRHEVKNLSFIASSYLPNVDAINYFIAHCWKEIADNYPEIKLSVYGTVCDAVKTEGDERIALRGFFPFIEDVYQEADIIINPVRFGAGLKIKNIEAMAFGMPLVTTTHGGRGLEEAWGSGVLIADRPEEITREVSSLLNNGQLRVQLGQAGQEYVAANFSPSGCFDPLVRVIEDGLTRTCLHEN